MARRARAADRSVIGVSSAAIRCVPSAAKPASSLGPRGGGSSRRVVGGWAPRCSSRSSSSCTSAAPPRARSTIAAVSSGSTAVPRAVSSTSTALASSPAGALARETMPADSIRASMFDTPPLVMPIAEHTSRGRFGPVAARWASTSAADVLASVGSSGAATFSAGMRLTSAASRATRPSSRRRSTVRWTLATSLAPSLWSSRVPASSTVATVLLRGSAQGHSPAAGGPIGTCGRRAGRRRRRPRRVPG